VFLHQAVLGKLSAAGRAVYLNRATRMASKFLASFCTDALLWSWPTEYQCAGPEPAVFSICPCFRYTVALNKSLYTRHFSDPDPHRPAGRVAGGCAFHRGRPWRAEPRTVFTPAAAARLSTIGVGGAGCGSGNGSWSNAFLSANFWPRFNLAGG